MTPDKMYLLPTPRITKESAMFFSDATFDVSSEQSYGQRIMLTAVFFKNKYMDAYHIIDWHSASQRCVSYSSFGAEILAFTNEDNRLSSMLQGLRLIIRNATLEHQLNFDSRALYDSITTLH